jgi:hypothetical protein
VVREVVEELGIEALRGAFIGSYPFARLNQIIFVYHVLGGAGPIRLAADELADYQEIPIEKLKPWPQGTGRGCAIGSQRVGSTRPSRTSERRRKNRQRRAQRRYLSSSVVNVKSLNCEAPSPVSTTALFGFSPQCQ